MLRDIRGGTAPVLPERSSRLLRPGVAHLRAGVFHREIRFLQLRIGAALLRVLIRVGVSDLRVAVVHREPGFVKLRALVPNRESVAEVFQARPLH